MNLFFSKLVASVVFSSALVAAPVAVEPGAVDFGQLNGAAKGEFVEVNLGRALLKLVAFAAKKENPEVAELISGLSRVRVNVLGLDQANSAATSTRVNTIREELARAGWEQVVTVRGQKEEDVAVFIKHRDGEVVDGLVVTVLDSRKRQAVLVNVVGQIKPEQLSSLGQHLQISALSRGTPTAK